MNNICTYENCSKQAAGKYCSRSCNILALRLAGYRKAQKDAQEKFGLNLIHPFENYRNKEKHLYKCQNCGDEYRLKRVQIRHSFGGCFKCKAERVKKKIDNCSAEQLSYIAGLIDAEGTIDIVQHRDNDYFARAIISNYDIPLLKYINSIVGFGRIYYSKDKCAKFNISEDIKRKVFLKAVIPFLKMKSRLADLSIKFPKTHKSYSKEIKKKQRKLWLKYKKNIADPLYGVIEVEFSNVKPFDIAYIAGFIDGDGWFGTSMKKHKKFGSRYYPAVTIANTHKPVMDWISCVFNDLDLPHTLAESKGTNKPMYYLLVRDNQAAVKKLCKLIRPFMHESSKIKQAEILLDFPELKHGGDLKWRLAANVKIKKEQAQLASELKRLKKER